MKIGIVTEDWKLATFERELKASKFEYTLAKEALFPGTTILYVFCEDSQKILELSNLIEAANCKAKSFAN